MDQSPDTGRNARALSNISRALNNWLRLSRRYQPSRTYMRGPGPACEQASNSNQKRDEGQIAS
jgi:hypothetical protein